MKQVLQNLGTGRSTVIDVPCPAPANGSLQILTSTSLVSAGTERMLAAFGRSSLLSKVQQQPDKVRQVLQKIRTDGLMTTLEAVRSKLDQPVALGCCNVGRVLATGEGVEGFPTGERVVSNGKHAEVVVVPQNLCARIPEAVDDESAAFTVLAAIGLQGVRLVNPTLGEAVVVTGLGLIGLLTVQILKANGCRVLGIDMDPARVALAEQFGAEVVDLSKREDPLAAAERFARGHGVDAVILTASTSSSEPVSHAARMCRKRGRIVLVGVTGLELSRADFYEKELSFQVSCSYGPGRYDPAYEEGGHDYPVGFVRWTEQRNFEAVLDLMASGALDVKRLVSHRFDIGVAGEAYDLLVSGLPSLGILLEYRNDPEESVSSGTLRHTVDLERVTSENKGSIAFIGAGNYAARMLIPVFKASGASLRTIVSVGGVTAVRQGVKHGFERASTDPASSIADPAVDAVVVATRHDSHAHYVLQALSAGKHVFVEKPLCLTLDELAQIEAAAGSGVPRLMVGFNRRFAPHVQRIKSLLGETPGPKAFIVTVNAGAIPAAHWTQNLQTGGGRLLGEGCHFIDLLRYLTDAPIARYTVAALDGPTRDSAIVTLTFTDGSIGTIHFLSNGSKAFPKERLEIFAAGRVLQLDNFRRLTGVGWPGFSKMNLWRQNKGQGACAQAFVDALRSAGPAPIPLAEIIEVSRISIEIQRAL